VFSAPLSPINLLVQRCPTSRLHAPKRILIVKFGALGDILMTTPLLTALRAAYPEAHFTWLVDTKNAQAIDANPHIDEIMRWDGDYWSLMRSTRPRNWIKNRFGFRRLAGRIRLKHALRRRFDLLISFHPEQDLMRSAADPTVSIGVFQSPRQEKREYEARYTKSYKSRYDGNTAIDFPAHQTDIYLLPLDALGLPPATNKRMVLGYTAEDRAVADEVLEAHGVGASDRFAVLAPLTTWPSKCWPEERWAELGDALAREGKQVVLTGSPAEREAVGRIASAMQSAPVMLAGLLGFREAAALIARASLCVSSDSGTMHVAAAVGTPIVSLFGPTPSARYAPLEGAARVLLHPLLCSPCMEQVCRNPPESQMACLRLLTVSEVQAAVLSALSDEMVCR